MLHREVDDFCPGVRQEHPFLKQHGLCATVAEEKFIGNQYFIKDDKITSPNFVRTGDTLRENRDSFRRAGRRAQHREMLPERCPLEASNSEVPTSE